MDDDKNFCTTINCICTKKKKELLKSEVVAVAIEGRCCKCNAVYLTGVLPSNHEDEAEGPEEEANG